MSKPSPPKNTPFRDLLSGFREKLISQRKPEQHKQSIKKNYSSAQQDKKKNIPSPIRQLTEKDIKRVLNSNYSGPPIVIRKNVQIKTEVQRKEFSGKSNDAEVSLSISKFPNPPIQFSWVKHQKAIDYKFDYSKGKQFQPTQFSFEDIRELAIGFDFGTSSSKITIRDRQATNSFAISFGDTNNIDSYLLPSKIYKDQNLFTLIPRGKEFSNLKIRAISSFPAKEDILACIAYMALVIRHARSQFFNQFDNNYRGQHFLWRLNVGIPARTVQKFEIKDRILNICRAALICSFGDSESISESEAQFTHDLIAKENLAIQFDSLPIQLRDAFGGSYEGFLEDGVRIYPEIMAQIHGFLRSNAWNPELNPHIMMIDIGAGTLDVSLCDVIKNHESIYCYYPLACLVEGLGVSNFVKSRIDMVYKLVELLPIDQQECVKQTLLSVDDINYGKISVPSALDEMLEGFKFSGNDIENQFDKAFKLLIGPALWSQTTFKAAQRFLPGHESWNPFPVFLCGGGSRMIFYQKFIRFYADNHGYRARFDVKELPKPRDLFNLDAESSDYDRLSVAYGLGYWDLGEFLADFENPKMDVVGIETPTWSDSFVSKDMT
jgi:hypothetical protein